MNKEYEKLLLTPEEISSRFGATDPILLLLLSKVPQAQLDKTLNQPCLDKPDSEGWWWFQNVDKVIIPVLVKGSYGQFWQHETPQEISEIKGCKWQKAIVLDPSEKESLGISEDLPWYDEPGEAVMD